MAFIEAQSVDFTYPVYDLGGRSLKVTLMSGLKANSGVVHVTALRNVSLSLKEGDRLGLIGHNGAGKSTLLRMFAGVIHPSRGRIRCEGRVVPLIAKGLGLNDEFSGLQNIELPMRLLGATTQEVKHAREDTPAGTAPGDFTHLPTRPFSEGMRARLAFAICTSIVGDILVLDEWLGAGDAQFVLKAQERIMDMLGQTKIIVLASHSLDLLRSLCNKVCWMERGQVVMVGDADEVLTAYLAQVHRENAPAVA